MSKPSIFRKQIIMPTEHGSWAWLLVPFFVGAVVAGHFNFPVLLTLLGGLAGFFMRQPATVWLRVQRGKARRADGPLAAGWTAVFATIALICLTGLFILERGQLLWLLLPLALIFPGYLLAARYGRAGLRSLGMELSGAVALSLMAPAAALAANGSFQGWMWGLWGLMALQNLLGAFYVRLRIFDTHAKPINRAGIVGYHGLGLILALVGAGMAVVPWLTAVPFAAFFARSLWAAAQVRPVSNVKKFGFTELGIAILSGAWIAASYWLA